MNITFLIGNGFDLNLGLKTKYTDFLEHYLKDDKNDNDTIKQFKKDIEKNLSTWADAELAFGKYTKTLNSKEDCVTCWKDFVNNLNEYLKGENIYLETDEELKNFYNRNSLTIKNDFDKIFANFSSIFNKKLANMYPFKDSINFYKFINFNYTKTLDIFLKNYDGKTNGNYRIFDLNNNIQIHNSLDEHLIFGVNNIDQVNKELLENTIYEKFFIKHLNNDYLGDLKYETALDFIKNSNVLFVYGMSLGATDKFWWTEICNWLNSSTDRHLIFYIYYEKKDHTKLEFTEKEYEIENKLLDFADDTVDKEKIRKQIHCIEYNIFQNIKDMFKKSDVYIEHIDIDNIIEED